MIGWIFPSPPELSVAPENKWKTKQEGIHLKREKIWKKVAKKKKLNLTKNCGKLSRNENKRLTRKLNKSRLKIVQKYLFNLFSILFSLLPRHSKFFHQIFAFRQLFLNLVFGIWETFNFQDLFQAFHLLPKFTDYLKYVNLEFGKFLSVSTFTLYTEIQMTSHGFVKKLHSKLSVTVSLVLHTLPLRLDLRWQQHGWQFS